MSFDLPALADVSDHQLVALIARGDQAAFRAFARRHVAKSLAIAQRVVGNPSDAEEVVQDAMLRVWRHAAQWRRTEAQVTTWLYRIVVNLAIDGKRKRQAPHAPIEEASELADPRPSPDAAVEGNELARFMTAAIAALPARQRIALTLCYSEGLDCAEAARVMQISVSAMESLLVRARRCLRSRLDRRNGGSAQSRSLVACSGREPAKAMLGLARLAGSFA